MSDHEPDDDNVIFMSFADEWAQLIRRMGAQLSKDPDEVVAFALRHLDTVLNLSVEAPVVIKRRADGYIDVGTIIETPQEAVTGSDPLHELRKMPEAGQIDVYRSLHDDWVPLSTIPAHWPNETVRWRLRS